MFQVAGLARRPLNYKFLPYPFDLFAIYNTGHCVHSAFLVKFFVLYLTGA